MQIFKNILLACSLAVAASPVYLRAEDTAAQAAARAALQQKMREVKGQPLAAPAEPANPPAAAETYQTSPPETPQPKVKPPVSRAAKPSETLLAPEPAKPDLIEQARQATRAKMAELQSQSQSAPAGAQPPVFQPVPTQPTPPSVVESATPATAPLANEVKPAKPSKEEFRAAKEREAAEKRAAAERTAAEKAAAKEAKAVKTEVKKSKPEAAKIEAPAAFPPLEAPASNLPASKEQRLQSLLEQYKADQITAEEYHTQRAKVLAEP